LLSVLTRANTRPKINKESPEINKESLSIVPRLNLVFKKAKSKGRVLQKRVGFKDKIDNILARHKIFLSTILVKRNIIVKINSTEFLSLVSIVIKVAAVIADNCYFTTSINI